MGQVVSSVLNWVLGAYQKRNSSSPRLSDPLNPSSQKSDFAIPNANHVITIVDDHADHRSTPPDFADYEVFDDQVFTPSSSDVAVSLSEEELSPNSSFVISLGAYHKRNSSTPRLSDPLNPPSQKSDHFARPNANHVITIIAYDHVDRHSTPPDFADDEVLFDDQVFTSSSSDVAISLSEEELSPNFSSDPSVDSEVSSWSIVVDPDSAFIGQDHKREESIPFGDNFEEVKQVITISDVDLISRPNEKFAEVEKKSDLIKPERWIKHYCSSHKILLVGEGDFSFSACLGKAFRRADNMVATSLNSKDFLQKNYGQAMSNINTLKSRGCRVIHDVDATKMAGYDYLNIVKYDRIVYNFPHAGFSRTESRQDQIGRHQNLVRLFLMNAKKMIAETGEIHISHKSYGFFKQWGLQKLGKRNGLVLIEEVEFNLSDYPGYNTKYGYGGDKNFNCNPSKTYKFQLKQ